MRDNEASGTAEFMAFFRAQESALPVHQRLFSDPYASSFLSRHRRRLRGLFRAPFLRTLLASYIDRRWPGARTSAIARTRLIDDWAGEAVSLGARQIVVLGAGFDTRAWRLPCFSNLPVFEVDHPATSARKSAIVRATGMSTHNVRFVAVDFEWQELDRVLAAAGFAAGKRALVIWEGVTNYLMAEAVDGALRWVATLAESSRLIFTYVDAGLINGSDRFGDAAAARRVVASVGEPWTFGLEPDQPCQLPGRSRASAHQGLGGQRVPDPHYERTRRQRAWI